MTGVIRGEGGGDRFGRPFLLLADDVHAVCGEDEVGEVGLEAGEAGGVLDGVGELGGVFGADAAAGLGEF